MRERTRLDDAISNYRSLEQEFADAVELIEMGEAEGDADIVAEAEQSLTSQRDRAHRLEMESLLSGEADGNDAYMEINSGAGGT